MTRTRSRKHLFRANQSMAKQGTPEMNFDDNLVPDNGDEVVHTPKSKRMKFYVAFTSPEFDLRLKTNIMGVVTEIQSFKDEHKGVRELLLQISSSKGFLTKTTAIGLDDLDTTSTDADAIKDNVAVDSPKDSPTDA